MTDAARQTAPAHVSRGELGLSALLLGLLALVAFSSHVRHGGFELDDWGVLSLVRSPGHHAGGVIATLWHYYSKRPGEVFYYALLDKVLGYHVHAQLALAAVMLLAQVMCLFPVLRMLGLALAHALAISALILIFPFSDSQWLWAIMSLATFIGVIYLLGVIFALRAFDGRGRRALVLHGISLVLYVLAILSYEIFGALGCLVGLLYLVRVGWARARLRWAADVVAIVVTLGLSKLLLPDDVATPTTTQSLSGMAHHGVLIARQGAHVLTAAALPFSTPPHLSVLALLGAVLAAAAVVRELLSDLDPARRVLGRWLVIAGAGVIVAVGAWAIYIPAIDFYSPGTPGTGNRVNALAGVGIVIFLYAVLMLASTLLARLLGFLAAARGSRRTPGGLTRLLGPGSPRMAPALVLALAAVLGAGYLHRSAADTRLWNRTGADQRQVLAELHEVLPRLPRAATLYALDYPHQVIAWVTVFAYPYDLTGALRWSYGQPGVAGVPVNAGTRFHCGRRRLYPTNDGYSTANGGGYGRAFFVDVGARRAVGVTDRAQCTRVTRALRAGRP